MQFRNDITFKKCVRLLFLAAILGTFATGCATYRQKNKTLVYWRENNLPAAVAQATKMADKNSNNKDTVLLRLEQGAVLRGDGQYDASNKAFDQAEEKIDQYAQTAKVKVGRETGAILSNQSELPYEGRAYDGIMLDTYRALNYLNLGEPDKARPALIRAYQRQQDAVDENARRIQNDQDELASQSQANRKIVEAAENNPQIQNQINAGFDSLKPYANYVNPFTVFMDGLFFMSDAADESDLERAHKSFERVKTFTANNNDYIKQDLQTVQDLQANKPLSPTTYVIFETGCAPIRDQIRIDIPTFWAPMPYLGAAFPTLKPQGNFAPILNVTTDSGANFITSHLASMDSVIAQNFKDTLPITITKAVLSTAIKATATSVAWQATQTIGNSDTANIAGFLVIAAAVSWQAANNIADERTWTTLPKEFQYCRLATPPDRQLTLVTANGLQKRTVTITNGVINLVYVKSITENGPLLVSQIKLK
jgi:hypothetical protein